MKKQHSAQQFLTLLTVYLITQCATARVPDRCDYKWGMQCFADKKCLWDPPDDEMSPLAELASSRVASSVCPKIVGALVAERDIDLELFLTSPAFCEPFCDGNDVGDCEAFLAGNDTFADALGSGGAPEASTIKDEKLLRRLKQVFDSGDFSEARRVLNWNVVPETFLEFLEKVMRCEMCTECYDDPREFSRDVRLFADLDEGALLRICEALIKTNDGECSSRCDPEHLSPEDCDKEDGLCPCKNNNSSVALAPAEAESEGVDTDSLSNTQDVLCPYKHEISDDEIESICEDIIEAQENIVDDPIVVCRSMCPPSGRCRHGFRKLDGIEDITFENANRGDAQESNESPGNPKSDEQRPEGSTSDGSAVSKELGGEPLQAPTSLQSDLIDLDADDVVDDTRRKLQSVDSGPSASDEDDEPVDESFDEEVSDNAETDDEPDDPPSPESDGRTSPESESSDVAPLPDHDGPEGSPSPSSESSDVAPSPTDHGPEIQPSPSSESSDVAPLPDDDGPEESPSPSSESSDVAPLPNDDGPEGSPSPSSESSDVAPLPNDDGPEGSPSPSSESSDVAPLPDHDGPEGSPSPSSGSSDVAPLPDTESPASQSGTSPSPEVVSVVPDEPEQSDAPASRGLKSTDAPESPTRPSEPQPSNRHPESSPQTAESSNEMDDEEERGDSIGPLKCALCEHCKAEPTVYSTFKSVQECKSYIHETILGDCNDTPIDTIPDDKLCDKDCVPYNQSTICSNIESKDICHQEKACRWHEDDHDTFSIYLMRKAAGFQRRIMCPAVGQLLLDLNEIDEDYHVAHCREALGCTDLDAAVCEFVGIEQGDGEHGRKLLSMTRHHHLKLRSRRLRQRFGRQLMDATSDIEHVGDLLFAEVPEEIMKCSMCTLCNNATLTDWGSYTWTDNATELVVSECRNETMEWYTGSHCESVCSSIPEANCALYEEYCRCRDEDEDEGEDEDETAHGPSGPDFGEAPGSCYTDWNNPAFLCYMKLDGNCSDGCTREDTPWQSRESYISDYEGAMNESVDDIINVLAMFPTHELNDLTTEVVCQLAGFCYYYLDQIGEHATIDNDCAFCARFEETMELTEYLRNVSIEADRETLQSMIEDIRSRYYGRYMCDRGCYDIEEKSECKAIDGCYWYSFESGDGPKDEPPEEAKCQCNTRMESLPCTLTVDGQCSEGCELNTNALLETWKATSYDARFVLRRGKYFSMICQDLKACSCEGFFGNGNCTDCLDCAESAIAYGIYSIVDGYNYSTVDYSDDFDVPDSLRDLLMQFAMRFLHAEICYLPECKVLKNTATDCSTKNCELYCELQEGYWVDRNYTVPIERPKPECQCEPQGDFSDTCSYDLNKDKCNDGCILAEGTSWNALYSKQYRRNLIYASTILARYKIEAGRQRSRRGQWVTAHDICRWINECPSNNTCWKAIKNTHSNITEECEECADCVSAEAVKDILYVFYNTTEDNWKTGISQIAENYAKDDASEEACQPSTCSDVGYDTCYFQSQCQWRCNSSDAPETPSDDDCTDFMINFRSNLEEPTPFCNNQSDVTLDECLASMAFIKAAADYGHLATMDSRLKLCKLLKKMPTTELLKQRLGFLFCDPSQQCCGSTDAFEDIGISLTETRCEGADGCEFSTECVPLTDTCYKLMLEAAGSDTLPSCSDDCVFVESTAVSSVQTSEGRGFCVDVMLEQTCRLDGQFECSDERCIEKPVCRSEIGRDYSCLNGDPCCIPTSDGAIEASECSSDTCQLGSRCVMKNDQCGLFRSQRECDYQTACQFIADGNPYDRSAGKCVTKSDRCAQLTSSECENSVDCLSIDSCETRVCDATDTCCPYSVDECRADDGCSYDGTCTLRDELNICQRLSTEEKCVVTYGMCEWKKETSECHIAEDECADVRTSRRCSYLSRCVFEEACVDACSRCETCINAFDGAFDDVISGDVVDVFAAQIEFLTLCSTKNYAFSQCLATSRRIAVSRGNWIRRPGALCLSLGDCKESCTDNKGTAVSRCTETGWDDGEDASIDDPCADCQTGEYCRRSGSNEQCICDAATGFDTCTIVGECVDKCDRYAAKIAQYNSYVTGCDDDDDCEDGFLCDENATSRNMTCSSGQISIAASAGACTPESRAMTYAQFGDDGRTITVDLNFPAMKDQFLASEIFDEDTVDLTGDAFVSVRGKSMTIYLRFGAKIVENDTLVLKDDQTRLRDAIQGTSFVNEDDPISVSICTSCSSPTVYINYPERISAGCSTLEPPKATFDGSLTIDYTGRRLNCQWQAGVGGDDSQCFRADTDTTTRTACSTLSDKLSTKSSRFMSFRPHFVKTLAETPGFYTIGLTCTNFLGMYHTQEIEFEVIGDPMPLISVPPSVYFQKSLGVVVPAFISQDSICPGDIVLYNWTSPDLEITDGSNSKKNFRMKGYVGAFENDNYTLDLEASLKKTDGSLRSEVGRAQVTLYPVRTPVVSGLDGPSGDVLVENTVDLTFSCYDPDDAANVLGAFGYERFCIRGNDANTDLSTDDASTQPCDDLGVLHDDGRIVLDAAQMTMDVWYTYTFTCTKDDREHASTIAFRPRSLESNVPTGTVTQLCGSTCPESHDPNQDLLLMVDVANDDTEITWECSVTLENDQIKQGNFNRKRLTILRGSLPEVDSIDCVAKLRLNDEDGNARITIKINAKPYCSDDDSCIDEEAVDDNYEFPLAKIKLSALNFADDQEESLTFVFGCYDENDIRRVYYKGTPSSYEVRGLKAGDHLCFVCAVDKIQSESCDYANVTIVEPADGITEEVLEAVFDAVDTAVASGDVHVVISSVNAALQLLGVEAAGLEEGGTLAPGPAPAQKRRRLLSTSTADPEALATSILGSLDFDPYVATEFTPAASTLATLSSSVSYETVTTIAETFDEALVASALDETSYTSSEAEQLTSDVATVMARLIEDWSDDTDALTTLTTYSSLQSSIEDLMCMNVALGQEAVASATLTSGNGISVGCKKDQPSDLAGMTFTVRDVFIDFSDDLETACGSDCPSTIDLRVSVTDNNDLHIGFLDTLVPLVGASDIETQSGIVKLEAADVSDDILCEAEGCALTVTIPVSTYNAEKTTACVRVNGASAEGLDDNAGISFVNGSYSEVNGTIQCEVQQLGEIFVVDFVALDPEELISDIELPSTLVETITNDTSESEAQTMSAELTFTTLDYAPYATDQMVKQDFIINLEYQLTQSSTIEGATYEVTDLRPGSVIATIEISLPTSVTSSEISDLVTTYQSDASSLFDAAFLTQYGPVSVTLLSAPGFDFATTPEVAEDPDDEPTATEPSVAGPESTPSATGPDSSDGEVTVSEVPNSDDDGPNLVVIIVPVVIGMLVLGGAVAFFATKACKRRNDFLDDL